MTSSDFQSATKRVEELMKQIDRPSFDDEAVASLIKTEAKQRLRLFQSEDVAKVMARAKAGGPASVNKMYLTNTILGVSGHNRREEEKQCWRELGMSREAQRRKRPRQRSIHQEEGTRRKHKQMQDEDLEEREYWAKKKARSMNLQKDDMSLPPSSLGSEDSLLSKENDSDSSKEAPTSDSKKKRRRSERKYKEEKKKKKKKSKEKHKKRKRDKKQRMEGKKRRTAD